MKLMKGDRVRLHQFHLFKGESIPDIPVSEWTGEILDTWGFSRDFVKVKRDFDGRVIPMMANDVAEILEKAKQGKRGRR